MKRSHKISLAMLAVVAVGGILFASNVAGYLDSNRGPITITNQGASMDKSKEVKSITQDADGHVTLGQ